MIECHIEYSIVQYIKICNRIQHNGIVSNIVLYDTTQYDAI